MLNFCIKTTARTKGNEMSHRYVTSILIAIIRVEVSGHEIHDFIQLRSWTEPCRLVMVPSIRPEIIKKKGLTINCTNEFVQSHFSDGVLILWYINKMGTNGEVGWWLAERDDFKRRYWSGVEIPTGCKSFFSLIFVYKLTSTNSYIL